MDKLLDKIVTDFGTYSYKIDTGLRGEIENMEKEIEAIQYKIKEKKQEAVDMGLAKIVIGKPSQLAPTSKMYIELHGQEAFDAVKRLGKAPERFEWIK
jgi:nitrogen fixation protein FixH|tara:strand:+ start:215 stop:508 length:294 start_codon:yes stop_codon:yes gene_type:complete